MNVPTRVRRSAPSTPPGAMSLGHADHGSLPTAAVSARRRGAWRIERNLSISKSRPSRPDAPLAEQHRPGES